MTRSVWLVKSEPSVYPFDQLLEEKKTAWDGVRNYEARNNLRAMKKGDTLLYYHSNEGKEIVGIARVTKEAYQDPTTDGDWSSVEIAPVKTITARNTIRPPITDASVACRRPRCSTSTKYPAMKP